MNCDFTTSTQFVQVIRSGLPSPVITVSRKRLVTYWSDATIDFTIYHDVDTIGLPFVFEAHLIDEDKRVVEPYGVYVVCMDYFARKRPSARGAKFGAISIVGRTDKFSPIQIVEIAREGQEYARNILAEVKKIWL